MNKELRERYSRQINIEGFGIDAQKLLIDAKILIVGAGALGSMVAMQLCGAGVGKIGVADFDTVDISNLQRQFFFKAKDAGKSKAKLLREAMIGLNDNIHVDLIENLITAKIAEKIFPEYDFIIDATDNPSSKIMVDSVCEKFNLPCCIAGVSEYHGQIMTILPGDLRFRFIFQDAESGGFLPCSLGGVIGPAAALCASIQASEAIKYITKIGEPLSNKILTFNLALNQFNLFSL